MRIIRRVFGEDFPFFFACPALLWQVLFLYLPILGILLFSFSPTFDMVSMIPRFTLVHYLEILNPIYFKIILNSFVLASLTGIICLLFAFPVAYFLAFTARRWRTVLLFALILPSWTNFIIQVYAWFFLLEQKGVFSRLLYLLGFAASPPQLLNTYFSTLVGMVYCFLPFMIFPIYAVLERMDKLLLEASADLGASHLHTLRKIIIPLSMPGIYAGFGLVFVSAFGEFAIPILLGGSKSVYWGNVIVDKFIISRNWASGFAFTVMGLIFLGLLVFALYVIQSFYHLVTRWIKGVPVDEQADDFELLG